MAQNARNVASLLGFCMQFLPSTFRVLGAFSCSISRQFNASISSISTLRCCLFRFARFRFIPCFSQSISVIIPVLTTFLQLKVNNDETKSPFTSHPATMNVAICGSVVYYLAYAALLRYPPHHLFVLSAYRCLVVLSGDAAVAALVAVLLPNKAGPVVYAVFGLLSAFELLHWVDLGTVAVEGDDAVFSILRLFRRVVGGSRGRNSSGQWRPLLPISSIHLQT